MSEARALTNFAGNAVATVLIGHWTGGLDRGRLDRVLAGDDPFDETTMLDGDDADVFEREFERRVRSSTRRPPGCRSERTDRPPPRDSTPRHHAVASSLSRQ